MNYTENDFVDKGEVDEDGNYDYIYEYTLYYFTIDNICYVFRSYKDNYREVIFLRKEVDGKILNLNDGEINSDNFKSIIKFLKEKKNKITVNLILAN